MQETEEMQGWEDHLKEEVATHSSIGAWAIPWTEEPGRLQSMGSKRARHDWVIKNTHTRMYREDELWALPGDFTQYSRTKRKFHI